MRSVDHDVFASLYRRHARAVFRCAATVIGNRETAEDLTSEAFLALYHNLDGIDQARLPGWLMKVVLNRARDLWRRNAVERRSLRRLPDRYSEQTLDRAEWILARGGLKPIHRKCLRLHYLHGMTRREIAAATGLAETQVKGHIQYALRLLRTTYVSTSPPDHLLLQ